MEDNIQEDLNNKIYNPIEDLLRRYGLNIVKVQSEKQSKYILYKEHPIYNYQLITKTTRQDLLDDLLHSFSKKDPNWWKEVVNSDKPTQVNYLVDKYLRQDVDRVNSCINDPAQPLLFTDEQGTSYFNYFQNTELLVNKPNVDFEFPIIHEIIWNLCEKNIDYYDWVINWFAVLYQYPTYRFSTSIIFIGAKGSGKGMLSKVFQKIFGNCCYLANSKDLISNFNSQLFEGKLLLMANEIVDQHNKYQFSNDLKELITEENISVEKKFSDRYIAKNYIKTIFFSNSSNPIVIEEGDRRYFVVKATSLNMDYKTRQKFFEDEDYFTKEVLGFCTFLNNYPINQELVVSEPIMTPAKQSIININLTDFKGRILDIMVDNIDIWIIGIDGCYFPNSKLFSLYKGQNNKEIISGKKFTAKLRNNDFIVLKKTIDKITDTLVRIPDVLVEKSKNGDLDNYE